MFVALLQIFLYCRPGDELIAQVIQKPLMFAFFAACNDIGHVVFLQSTAIGHAAYESLWTSLDSESIRKMSMIILRSQHPLKMTAGKIYILSLPNFTKVRT